MNCNMAAFAKFKVRSAVHRVVVKNTVVLAMRAALAAFNVKCGGRIRDDVRISRIERCNHNSVGNSDVVAGSH